MILGKKTLLIKLCYLKLIHFLKLQQEKILFHFNKCILQYLFNLINVQFELSVEFNSDITVWKNIKVRTKILIIIETFKKH